MRRTGWIVIAAFVGIPALMFAVLWGCWRGGMLDSVPAPGTIQVSALFRAGDTIECSLAPTQPGHDLVRYEILPPRPMPGGPATAIIRVWQRPIVLGKRPGKRLQVTVPLPEPGSAVALRQAGDDTLSVIWPPPKMPAPAGDSAPARRR